MQRNTAKFLSKIAVKNALSQPIEIVSCDGEYIKVKNNRLKHKIRCF